jgi:ABC-type glutathione transport system ATPase component
MGLLERKKQKARALSSGEQQRLAFIRALIFKPRLIIADEAVTAMDMEGLSLFEEMIKATQESDPITWLIISHHISHVRRLADYLFFIYQGKIEAEGPAEELFANPSCQNLRRYLGVYASM